MAFCESKLGRNISLEQEGREEDGDEMSVESDEVQERDDEAD